MLDIAGALFVGAYLATLVATLVWSASGSIAWRLVLAEYPFRVALHRDRKGGV